mmetsp:Transcript_36358/g.109933  ORF Transcript_36358/g.109933 Transcript_36358/m.109933 type:complete len:272 (+) Transcript_36358:2480-3295(+)
MHAMPQGLARYGRQTEKLREDRAIVPDDPGAAVHVVAEAAAVRARVLHLRKRLRRQEEGPPAAAVPVVRPLVVDEAVQVARGLPHGLVVLEGILVASVVHAGVLGQVHAVDRVARAALQRLVADHDERPAAVLRVHAERLRQVRQLVLEAVGDLVVDGQRKGQQPARAPCREERRPTPEIERRAHARQQGVQLLLECGLRPRRPRHVQRHQEGHGLQGRRHRIAGEAQRWVHPVLDGVHQLHVLREARVLVDLREVAAPADHRQQRLQVQG